ncbi:MAG: hypothetical protein MI924_28160, partial [Chloroflexales bacterium]|nr:hypothetical protein [Chloroflexales bacterium]
MLAVLLALLPVYCIADVVLHVLAPSNEPFKDVGTQMDPTIYARWTEGFKLPALNPEAVRAADAEERRRAQPPAIIPGITAIATVVEVIQPPVEVVIVPTPTIPARNPSSTTTSVAGVVRTPSPSRPNATSVPRPTPTSLTRPTSIATILPAPATATAINQPFPTSTISVGSPTTTRTIQPTPTTTTRSFVTPTRDITPIPSATPITDPVATLTLTTTPLPTATATATSPPTATNTPVPPPTATNTPVPPPTSTPTVALPILSINDTSVVEGNAGTTTNAVFTVSLSAASDQTVTVDFATSNGTANAGSDYISASGVLTFPAGVTTRIITVVVNGDDLNEPDQTFFVTLSNPSNATITRNRGTGTILNDDPAPPELRINNINITEGTTLGVVDAVFTVTLSPPVNNLVTVDFATANGTARAGSDYITRTGTLIFMPGQATQPITVPVASDLQPEGSETFFVDLSNATNAAINTSRGTATITDPLPPITINDTSVVEGDTGTTVNATFTVGLAFASVNPISVNYATVNGSASAGSDYLAQTGVLNFAPGQTAQTIEVTVLGDNNTENNEIFFVDLSNATNAVIQVGRGTGSINDDDQLIQVSKSVQPASANAIPLQIYPLTYTLVIANNTTGALTINRIIDNVADEFLYSDCTPSPAGGSCNQPGQPNSGGDVTWTGAQTLAPGGVFTLQIRGVLLRAAPGNYFNENVTINMGAAGTISTGPQAPFRVIQVQQAEIAFLPEDNLRVTVTPTPTATPTRTPTATPTRTPTATPTASRTPHPTATLKPTRTPHPTATLKPTRTPHPTVMPTRTPHPSSTPTSIPPTTPPAPTATPVPTTPPAPTATPVPTAPPAPTATPVPTAPPAPTATPVPTTPPAPTATPVPTAPPAPT